MVSLSSLGELGFGLSASLRFCHGFVNMTCVSLHIYCDVHGEIWIWTGSDAGYGAQEIWNVYIDVAET
jgi:hypothetical protein